MKEIIQHLDDSTRRQFVKLAAQSLLGVTACGFATQAFGQQAKKRKPNQKRKRPTRKSKPSGGSADSVIFLFMSGGMSHLDTFDPKPGREKQGPTKAISSRITGVKVSEHLPKTAQILSNVSMIRSMTSTQGAHAPGRYLAHTSYAPRATIRHPSLASWVMNLVGRDNEQIPGNVVIAGGSDHPGAGFMDLKYGPLPLGDPEAGVPNSQMLANMDAKQFDRRMKQVEQFSDSFLRRYPNKKVKGYGEMYAEAIKLMRSEDLKAFDLAQETEKVRDNYGREKFGQGCLLARRLIEHGVRFVEVGFGGWDTHTENFERLTEKLPILDQAYSALIKDLNNRGLLKKTLVVLVSEFGRSPKINERTGRDHHPAAFTSLLAGGGIKSGYVHGSSDEDGHAVEDAEVTFPDLNATIAKAIGVPIDKTVFSSSRRPFKVADDGQPVEGVFA